MKKITLSVILAGLFLFSVAPGATQAQGLVNFGIKGGVNIANISFDDFDDNDPRTGFTIGAALNIGFPMLPVGLETGLYYSQQGTTLKSTLLDLEGTTKLDYLKIPVLAKVMLGPPGPLSPYFVAGPYAAFILNAEQETTTNGLSGTVDISDEVESVDFGLTMGVGADFKLMPATMSVQIRYSYGLTDIFEETGSKNRVLSILAGFSF